MWAGVAVKKQSQTKNTSARVGRAKKKNITAFIGLVFRP
jgi:hypothetical protein